MFYLKEFFKVAKENLILTFIFIFCSVSLVSISHNRIEIQSKLSLAKRAQSFPYFNALVSGQTEIDGVVRRMKQLPGVVSVKKTHNKKFNDEVSQLSKAFGEDVINSLSSISYLQLKIELEKGIRKKSQNLIREYLTRLVGGESITMGMIRFPQKLKIQAKDPLVKFLKWIDVYSMGILVSLWALSVILLLKSINVSAFIIEKFQRRTFTNLKIFLSGIGIIVIPTMIINYLLNQKINYMPFAIVFIMIAFIILASILFKKGFKA